MASTIALPVTTLNPRVEGLELLLDTLGILLDGLDMRFEITGAVAVASSLVDADELKSLFNVDLTMRTSSVR